MNNFSYVGITLTQQLSFNKMAFEQALKAKRVLISVISQLYEYGQLPQNIFFNIFDTKISPILLYGSEIWGINKLVQPELVHNYACKRYLCVKEKTINAGVRGDCGRFPMFIGAAKRAVKYWCKITKMGDHRLVKKAYNMQKFLDNTGQTNWCSGIRKLLCSNGFGYIWYNQSVLNERSFFKSFVQKLKDQYIQEWQSLINDSSKLIM